MTTPSPHARPNLSKIPTYIPGKSIDEVTQELGLTDVIKLASNENPLGPAISPEDLAKTIQNIHYYPHTDSAPLLTQLSQNWHCQKSQFIIGNGSDEIIQLIALAYLNSGEELITSEHTFSEYDFACQLMAGTTRCIPMRNWTYDLSAIAGAITPKTKLICIANPNNPTGTIVTHQELTQFLRSIPPTVLVVLDEAYAEYVTHPDYPNAQTLLSQFPNLIVLRTFSKLYGLAGFRIGYGISNETIISTLKKVKQPFNVSTIALKAAELALKNDTHIQQSLALNAAGKAALTTACQQLNLPTIPSEANFLAINVKQSAKEISDALLKQGVIVRSLHGFNMLTFIRVTIGTDSQNQRFLTALKTILSVNR